MRKLDRLRKYFLSRKYFSVFQESVQDVAAGLPGPALLSPLQYSEIPGAQGDVSQGVHQVRQHLSNIEYVWCFRLYSYKVQSDFNFDFQREMKNSKSI